ncbi:protein PBDC1 [Trichonephila clavipes]|nr:protein PBDC1 [Trichonephila clavipes]
MGRSILLERRQTKSVGRQALPPPLPALRRCTLSHWLRLNSSHPIANVLVSEEKPHLLFTHQDINISHRSDQDKERRAVDRSAFSCELSLFVCGLLILFDAIVCRISRHLIYIRMAIPIELLKEYEEHDPERRLFASTEHWAEKIIDHTKIYDNLITSVPLKDLKLTPQNDVIYDRFMEDFPDFNLDNISKNDYSSDTCMQKWKDFIRRNIELIEEPAAATLIRVDCSKGYTPKNLVMVRRLEFLALEIARNKLGLNDIYKTLVNSV